MPGIFISYRRLDSATEVGRIVDVLSSQFGKSRIFNDVFDIRGGQKFRDIIKQRLDLCNVVLVVVGNKWANVEDEAGRRRLEDPEDYVRMEVEVALTKVDCLVIPVLVNHQTVPNKIELPEKLHELLERNAMHVRPDPDFANDMHELCKVIANHVPRKKKWPTIVVGSLLMVAAIVGAYFLGPGRKTQETMIQAYDATTGDRILRPFGLTINGDNLLPATQHRIGDVDPKKVAIELVDAPGFQSKPVRTSVGPFQNALAVNLELARVLRVTPLEKISYFDSIQPVDPFSIGGWPDDEERKRKIKANLCPAKTVKLIVKNMLKKEAHLDVFLLWLPPSDAIELNNPFAARWSHLGPIKPGGRLEFNEFGLEPGFFAFYGSTNGLQALRLHCDALYQAEYAIATIYELSEPGFSLTFSSIEP